MIKEMDFTGFKHTMGAVGSGIVAWYAGANLDGMLQTLTLVMSASASFLFTIKIVFEILLSRKKLKDYGKDSEEKSSL